MINEMRGVPGVQSERLTEAFTVKHCALSLVGEPIMYPRINEMLSALHAREISSFMVTNAQFPEHIQSLDPVTQLYVSVDASTRDSLKAIDRPLFKGASVLSLLYDAGSFNRASTIVNFAELVVRVIFYLFKPFSLII